MFVEIPDKMYLFLLQLSKEEIINIMLDALSEMQFYNGRSVIEVLQEAIQKHQNAKKASEQRY